MAQAKKHSKKRDAILGCLRSTTCHPSAEWVFSQLKPVIPDLSLATVYRNLARFLEDGTISSIGVIKGLERFDGTTEPHVHFICTGCGKILDLHDLSVPVDLEDQVSTETGGEVNCAVLSFHGRCRECRCIPVPGLSGNPV